MKSILISAYFRVNLWTDLQFSQYLNFTLDGNLPRIMRHLWDSATKPIK